VEFEWDENKNRTNQLKHGLSFETAIEIFDGRPRFTEAAATVKGEERLKTIGSIGAQVIVLVVYVFRGRSDEDDVIRVISARKASKSERLRYDRANT
jgi:uncharacterized protein